MTTREVEHEITIAAPAPAVYRLLAEVTNWPRIFPPTIHVDRVEHDGSQERIRVSGPPPTARPRTGPRAANWTPRPCASPSARR